MTEPHSRGRRPTQRIRTPHSCSWSRRRRMTSRLKPMRKRTSSGLRFQFSVENAYADRCVTPTSMAPATTSSSGGLPRLVALGARQAALVRPPAVAVHDDGDVARHPLERRWRAGGRRSGAGTAAGTGWVRSPLDHPAGCGRRARGATGGTPRSGRCPRGGGAGRRRRRRPSRRRAGRRAARASRAPARPSPAGGRRGRPRRRRRRGSRGAARVPRTCAQSEKLGAHPATASARSR